MCYDFSLYFLKNLNKQNSENVPQIGPTTDHEKKNPLPSGAKLSAPILL